MSQYSFTLRYPDNYSEISVDQLMRKLLIPRKWRHFLRSERQILINGKYLPLNFLIHGNDHIQINLNHVESFQQTYKPSGKLPQIIYENDNLLVINKPAGQKTHPNLDETNTALNDCATYLNKSPYIVHRLDMLTNGLLLVAKNPAVVPILNRQLTNKTLNREYIATVDATNLTSNKGTISMPIGQDPNDQRKRIVRPDGLKAVTHYQLISKKANLATLAIKLETGRTHQIRVHLSSIACPIIGDPLYNPNFKNGQKLLLTAYRLTFQDPFSFNQVTVKL
ncbi:23S rRNA pseudouridine1911/1915/1917 synthase [Lactobacillus colini]|uniref:RNA pseudouridylate synthase n=1 Tax=Lactobacillus colini TaxID=1819254 RepID=A0ABS4MF07_9LACO|nr:RluA family pseudouridine synthase [Lactobacillus colini]MBP2058266.1 23S rRNA pseudouridine1911/1915/1917 synthase [Lactobacillus colini]